MAGDRQTVSSYIDDSPLRGTLLLVPVLCGLLLLTEGIDTYGVGYVGPFISREFGIGPEALGVVYTGSVVASLIGAVVLAPLSDRVGRRRVLILSSLLMSVCALLTPFASSIAMLFAVRFAIGMAFGAAVPTAFALTADYAPARLRSMLLMMMSSGVALGIVLAGIAAAFIIPAYGWRMLLFVSGGLSAFWTVVLWMLLPESLQFLILRQPNNPEGYTIAAGLASIRGEAAAPLLRADEVVTEQKSALDLIRQGRAVMTGILWFVMSAAYCAEFFISYWLPTLLLADGASMKQAGLITAAGKFGSIMGAVVIGRMMDRFGASRILSLSFTGTAVAVVVLGNSAVVTSLAAVMVIVVCFLLDGSFAGSQALTANSYPGSIRATGTGWVTGLARLMGGGLGTMAGGYFVAQHSPVDRIAFLLAIPLLLAGLVLFLFNYTRRSGRYEQVVINLADG